MARIGTFQRCVGQSVPNIGIWCRATAYRNAHFGRIADMDYRIGIHHQFRRGIDAHMDRIGGVGFVHANVFIIADSNGNHNIFVRVDTVERKGVAVRRSQLAVAVPFVVIALVHGTGSRKVNRSAHADNGITRNLRYRSHIVENIQVNVAAVNGITVVETRVGGDGRTTEQGVGYIMFHAHLIDNQGNIIGSRLDAVVRSGRIENRPGGAKVVRHFPIVVVRVGSEALYLQVNVCRIAQAGLGSRTTQNELRAGKHFHMHGGFVAGATNLVACLNRIVVVYLGAYHSSAVGLLVRRTDVERGIPFVGNARFPIFNHFSPKGGFLIIVNHRIHIRLDDRRRQYMHAQNLGLHTVGIQALDFG